MPKLPRTIRNPALDELIYTILYSSPYHLMRNLEPRLAALSVSEKKAKKFSSTATKEQIEEILSAVGLQTFYVISPNGLPKGQLRELLKQFEKDQKGKALDEIIQSGMFVSSDKQLVRLLGLMSQTIHHPNYFRNVELVNAGNNFKKWSKRNLSQSTLEIKEDDESARVILKSIAAIIAEFSNPKPLFEFLKTDLAILSYMYSLHFGASDTDMIRFFKGAISGKQISVSLRTLIENNLVTKDIMSKKKLYNLTSLGVRKCNQVLHHFLLKQ